MPTRARLLGLSTVVIFVGVLASGVLTRADHPSDSNDRIDRQELPGFAVLELFTSEGCSSCPPADDVLAELDAAAREHDQPVYALAYHVDYWDRLGWPDRFADPAYTQRQRDYAQAFRSNRIYTPQLVVNGMAEFVGSREATAHDEIARARQIAPEAQITLGVQQTPDAPSLRVKATLDSFPADSVLHVALVQSFAQTDVKRGENARRRLSHVNVVRAFETVTPRSNEQGAIKATVALPIPAEDANASFEVVAFLQVDGTGPIVAAQRAAVPDA